MFEEEEEEEEFIYGSHAKRSLAKSHAGGEGGRLRRERKGMCIVYCQSDKRVH